MDGCPGDPHGCRYGRQIGIIVDDGFGTVAVVEHALPLIDHAQDIVVEDDGLDIDAIFMEGCKFLAVHHDTAITSE